MDVDVKLINKEKLNEFYNKSEELFLEYKPVVILKIFMFFFEDIKNQGKTINILSNTGFIKGENNAEIPDS